MASATERGNAAKQLRGSQLLLTRFALLAGIIKSAAMPVRTFHWNLTSVIAHLRASERLLATLASQVESSQALGFDPAEFVELLERERARYRKRWVRVARIMGRMLAHGSWRASSN